MQEHLNQIAENTGVPADLLERAARARAEQQGVAVEALVSGWAGGDAPAPASAPEPAPAAPPAAAPAASEGAGQLPEALLRRSAAAKAKREGRPLDEVLAEMGLAPEGGAAEAPAVAPDAAPAPAAPAAAATADAATAAEEEPSEDESEEESVSVFAGFPRWLAAAFVVVPMFALLYAGLAPNGPDCGVSGQLAINPLNGEAEACDGGASPFFTLGETIYEAQCVACHGSGGGGGVGPAFTGGAVLATFSACTDHIEWVAIGTTDWPLATYGDTAKPAGGGGVMPGYQNSLSAQEIAAVSLYERVAFGGEDIVLAETACGLVEGATAAGE